MAKKSTKKKSKSTSGAIEVSYKEPKSVNIKKAANGFVISSYGGNGETVEVAKTMKEANIMAQRMLKG